MRKFEKISYLQFKKDIDDNYDIYNQYSVPVRSTKSSAGYDFYLINDLILDENEVVRIPTGIKVMMNKDEFLMLVVRSSVGFKYNVRLTNQVGIIDADYYNNKDNEGHIYISVQNHSQKKLTFKKGDRIVQGIFTKYLLVDEEENILNDRQGCTFNKEEENKIWKNIIFQQQ